MASTQHPGIHREVGHGGHYNGQSQGARQHSGALDGPYHPAIMTPTRAIAPVNRCPASSDTRDPQAPMLAQGFLPPPPPPPPHHHHDRANFFRSIKQHPVKNRSKHTMRRLKQRVPLARLVMWAMLSQTKKILVAIGLLRCHTANQPKADLLFKIIGG